MIDEHPLTDKQAETVSAGVTNPVANMSLEEALKIASKLGEGENMGEWKTMSAKDFMNYWASLHPDNSNMPDM